MTYQKQILTVKEVEKGYSTGSKMSGIATFCYEDGFLLSNVDFFALKDLTDGEYHFKIRLFDNVFTGVIGQSGSGFTAKFFVGEISSAMCVDFLLLHVDTRWQNPPKIVAFADGTKRHGLAFYQDGIIKDYLSLAKQPITLPENEITDPVTGDNHYDDEQIATENYYDTALKVADGCKKTDSFMENINGKQLIDGEDACLKTSDREIQKEEVGGFDLFQDEKDVCFSQERPYYQEIKPDLDNIFSSSSQNYTLSNSLINSTFYDYVDEFGNSVAIGIIKEQDDVKYICYGIKGDFSNNEQDLFNGYATFIPISIYELKGDGYWVIFQDAITGKCVKPNNI
jgi:hypothetical protein